MLFPLQYHHQAHQAQHDGLQPWVLREHDCHVSHARHIAKDVSYNVPVAVEVFLARRIELRVVRGVVVALGQEPERLVPAHRQHPLPTRPPTLPTHPPPNVLMTRCTMGISLPLTLYTT